MSQSKKNLRHPLRRIFLTGVVVTFPTAFTLFAFYWLADLIDGLGAMAVNSFMPEVQVPRGLGLIGTALLIFGVGLFTSNYFGKKLYEFYEAIFTRIPFINRVFSLIKQIFEMILSHDSGVFRHAVLLEFPRKGLWIIGFLSADAAKELSQKVGHDLVSVFVPTTPNPTSGVLMFVPREDILLLDMSLEDASKVIISGGIITPEIALESKK
jgi:uncharacterized membrane protein